MKGLYYDATQNVHYGFGDKMERFLSSLLIMGMKLSITKKFLKEYFEYMAQYMKEVDLVIVLAQETDLFKK